MARLSAEDWVDAAYDRFSQIGLAAVAVEPVARSIGATKGSFYWHFSDRRALVDAVLDRWQELETERVIRLVEEEATPSARLATLLEVIALRTGERGGERTLYSDAAAIGVSARVALVTERRVSYVAELLRSLGFDAPEARRRGVIVVSAVIGYQQLSAGGWDPGDGAEPRPLIETLFEIATGYPNRPET